MGDDGIFIDPQLVLSRITALFKHFSKNVDLYQNANALQLVHGKRAEGVAEELYIVSLQIWLFGYEFPDTVALLTTDGQFFVHASVKKLDYLKSTVALAEKNGSPVKIHLLPREKGDNTVPANQTALSTIINAVTSTGGKLGTFPSDPLEGPIAQGWVTEVPKAGITTMDASKGIEGYFAVKDAAAINDVKKAGVLAARVLKYVVVPEMESIIDEGKKITNAAFSSASSATAEDKAKLEKLKIPIDTDNFENILAPVVQSGGEYNINLLRPGTVSSNQPLSYDVIIMGLAMRYKGMRATIARTCLIDPTPAMQRLYDIIVKAHSSMINKLRPGAVINEAVIAVRDELLSTEGMPMSAKLTNNFGTGMGNRLTDRYLALSHKNTAVVQEGMVFNVVMGLSDIPLEDKHPVADAPVNKLNSYALFVADTVLVTNEGPVILTEKAPRDRKQISYEMAGDDEEEEDEEEEEEKERDREKRKSRTSSRNVVIDANAGRDATGRSARLREKAKDIDPDAFRKRDEHQAELVVRKQQEIERGGSNVNTGDNEADEIENAPDITAYRSTADFPKGTRPNQIVIDKSRDSVLLPILGTLVPFHISTIKNVNKTEEGTKHFLRINFYSPGQALGKDVSPSMQAAMIRNPSMMYIRTLNFISRDGRNFTDVDQKIKAMLKTHRTQRKEEKETAGLIEQARLIVKKDGVVPKMVDVNMWPAISGRTTQGTLAAQVNGLSFVSNKGERVEIIYGNIKTAVFLPCEGEHIVLLHFHLKNPILIGKKKFREVQFFTEVVERVVQLDGRNRSDYDPDELNEEERERQLRLKLNKAFKIFVQKVEDSAALDAASSFRSFEVPTKDLAFAGAWSKEMTTILLGANAIVAVVDRPPLVVPVDDIELVHFERVTHGGKSFDMVIVYKAGVMEKGMEEFVRISSIEMKHVETIKTWLDEVAEVIYTESIDAFLWKTLITSEIRNPRFWLDTDEDGNPKNVGMGEILHPYADGDEDGAEEEMDESEEYSEDESEEESEDEDEDDDDDYASEDDDSSDYEEEDSEDDGEDWDELERKAEEADRKRRRDEDDDDDDDRRKPRGKRK